MTFGATLEERLTMAASANMFYIAIDYKNKIHMKVAGSNINIKIHQLFSKEWILSVCVTISGNLAYFGVLLNSVRTILVKIIIIKLILIGLSDLFFNSFMKIKKVYFVSRFYENQKRMRALKIQRKSLFQPFSA